MFLIECLSITKLFLRKVKKGKEYIFPKTRDFTTLRTPDED